MASLNPRSQPLLLTLLLSLTALPLRAEILVIVNAGSGIESMTPAQVSAIALGRNVTLPSGAQLRIVEQSTTRFIFHDFHRQITGMSRVQLNAYWARLIFSGTAKAPRRLDDDAAVIAAVSADPGLMGYVSEVPENAHTIRVVLSVESARKPAKP